MLLVAAISSILITPISQGKVKHQKQPLHITANETTYDQKARHITYKGSVRATQGMRTITASSMTVLLDDKSRIKKVIAYGKPVTFHNNTSQHSPMVAASDQLTYLPMIHQIILLKHAHIKHDKHEISANEITYNLKTHMTYSRGSAKNPISMVIKSQS